MKKGERRRFVIGTGHGMCTCQGAAFEYIYNVDHTLRQAGVRDLADIIWISNEYELGDFGMGGVHITRGGYIINGKVFAESLMVGARYPLDHPRRGQQGRVRQDPLRDAGWDLP